MRTLLATSLVLTIACGGRDGDGSRRPDAGAPRDAARPSDAPHFADVGIEPAVDMHWQIPTAGPRDIVGGSAEGIGILCSAEVTSPTVRISMNVQGGGGGDVWRFHTEAFSFPEGGGAVLDRVQFDILESGGTFAEVASTDPDDPRCTISDIIHVGRTVSFTIGCRAIGADHLLIYPGEDITDPTPRPASFTIHNCPGL